MMKITKEQEPMLAQLKQLEKQIRQAAEQVKVYQNSIIILQRTIKKNQLTMMQLQKVKEDRQIFIPLGRAFLQRQKKVTINEMDNANLKLQESMKQMEKQVNQKQTLYKEGTQRLMNAVKNNT